MVKKMGEFEKRLAKYEDKVKQKTNKFAGALHLTQNNIGHFMDIVDEAKKEFRKIIKEIERNATEDTLFERMVLARLEKFNEAWFGDKE